MVTLEELDATVIELTRRIQNIENNWQVNEKLTVGQADPKVVIEGGKVDGRDVIVTSNDNNKHSIVEHIENPNAHKSLPITGGNLKFIDDPNPHEIEQDPDKDGYIGLSKDKIKDENGNPKESLVIKGVASETDQNKKRRMFIDSDFIVTNGEIKANNIRIRQSTSDFDGIANIGFMKTTEPFLYIEGAKGGDGINRTQIDSHVAVTTGIVCNGEIRGTGNITAPNGTINGKYGDFYILHVNGKNIQTEIENLRIELRSQRDDFNNTISDFKSEYKNHNHYLRMVKLDTNSESDEGGRLIRYSARLLYPTNPPQGQTSQDFPKDFVSKPIQEES